jgi:hypothetical protein
MKQIILVAILVAVTIGTSTTVVTSTNTIQMALATKKRGSDIAKGSNSKGPNAHRSSSGGGGGIGEAGGAGGVARNRGINVISGGGSSDCQIYG